MISKNSQRKKRHARIRKIITGTETRPRVVVYKSNTRTYVQVINDVKNLIIASNDTLSFVKSSKSKGKDIEICKLMGIELAKEIKLKKLDKIVFDRNGYQYHGKVKALAEGLREGGIIF